MDDILPLKSYIEFNEPIATDKYYKNTYFGHIYPYF